MIASDLRASASLVLAGIGGERRNDNRPRVPHRPRVRANRGQTRARRRRSSAYPGNYGRNIAHNPGFLDLVNDAKSRIQQIESDQYKAMRESGDPHILVDTREDKEWQAGHVSRRGPSGQGHHRARYREEAPDKNAKLVLYCGGGFRSALVADALAEDGLQTRSRSTAAGRIGRLPECPSRNNPR